MTSSVSRFVVPETGTFGSPGTSRASPFIIHLRPHRRHVVLTGCGLDVLGVGSFDSEFHLITAGLAVSVCDHLTRRRLAVIKLPLVALDRTTGCRRVERRLVLRDRHRSVDVELDRSGGRSAGDRAILGYLLTGFGQLDGHLEVPPVRNSTEVERCLPGAELRVRIRRVDDDALGDPRKGGLLPVDTVDVDIYIHLLYKKRDIGRPRDGYPLLRRYVELLPLVVDICPRFVLYRLQPVVTAAGRGADPACPDQAGTGCSHERAPVDPTRPLRSAPCRSFFIFCHASVDNSIGKKSFHIRTVSGNYRATCYGITSRDATV